MTQSSLLQFGRAVIRLEAAAVAALAERLDAHFERACEIMLATSGRVIVVGMGKSGHIGGKIAATLASTGTPAFFVHPGEASHGDLGMITLTDVVLAISNSGETVEILTILPLIKRMGVKLIALTGNPASTLARQADAHINVGVAQEACPMNLAPHHRGARHGRRPGGGAVSSARLHPRRFRALAPRRHARATLISVRLRHHARRR